MALIVALCAWSGTQVGRNGPVARDRAATPTQQFESAWEWQAGGGLLVAAAVGLARMRRQSRLLMYGRATVATVIRDVTPRWYRLRSARTWPRRLECEFRLPNRTTCTATVETRDRIPSTNEIVVVYDPDEPAKAAFYPLRSLKINVD